MTKKTSSRIDRLEQDIETLRDAVSLLLSELKSYKSKADNLRDMVEGLQCLMEPNQLHKATNTAELKNLWNFVVALWAKKIYNHDEIRKFIDYVWFLTDVEFRKLDGISRKEYSWVVLCQILRRMRIQLMTDSEYDLDSNLQFLSRQVHGAMIKTDRAAMSLVILDRPEVYKIFHKLRMTYMDSVPIPDVTLDPPATHPPKEG